MNNSIPILHDTVNGVVYIVQTNIIGLGQLDLPVMLRVILLQPVDMKILYKHVKGKSGSTSLKQFGSHSGVSLALDIFISPGFLKCRVTHLIARDLW